MRTTGVYENNMKYIPWVTWDKNGSLELFETIQKI